MPVCCAKEHKLFGFAFIFKNLSLNRSKKIITTLFTVAASHLIFGWPRRKKEGDRRNTCQMFSSWPITQAWQVLWDPVWAISVPAMGLKLKTRDKCFSLPRRQGCLWLLLPVLGARAASVPAVPRQSQGLAVLPAAQMQLLATRLNPDVSVYFRLCNGWIKCNPLFLCLWQIKVIFLLDPRLGVVLCCFLEWGSVLIKNRIYNIFKKPNMRTCFMPYIKDFFTVFYFILWELCLPESSSEIDLCIKASCPAVIAHKSN